MSKIPHTLIPYLGIPPEHSLILITSVLNATSNWLLLLFLSATLNSTRAFDQSPGQGYEGNGEDVSVVLVSFLRDWIFWKDSAKRLQCDIIRHGKDGRLLYMDGASSLFTSQGNASDDVDGKVVLLDPEYAAVEKAVLEAIQATKSKAPNGKVVLLVDGLDLLLAATGQSVEHLLDVVAGWREQSYAVIVTAATDLPLIQSQSRPLETSHAAFTTSLAHQARTVISLRLLSTGEAKDVSGVVRITKGSTIDEEEGGTVEEKELLYFVGGDGNAKIFERGSG